MTDARAGPLIVVAAALIRKDGKLLVQRRPPGKTMAGLWEFPGGKLEPGESPEQALVRELAEELAIGVAVEACRPLSFASESGVGHHLLLLLYRVESWAGKPVPRAATALRWATPATLVGLPMPPADRPLVAALAAAAG